MHTSKIILLNSIVFAILFVASLFDIEFLAFSLAGAGFFINLFLMLKLKSKSTTKSVEIDERELIMQDLDREADRRREAQQFNRN